jgi:hypothetical protein
MCRCPQIASDHITARISIHPADYPAGALTGMGIVACTDAAGLPSLCAAGAIRLGATGVTFHRRAVLGWLIAAGVCVLACAALPVAASFPDLA